MTILETIIAKKKQEVASLLQEKPTFITTQQPVPFKSRVTAAKNLQIIAEIKRASPSKGDICTEVNPVEQAKQYEACGATAISVLTDKTFFKGSMQDLSDVANAVHLPVLCKDFIIHPIQIDQARAAGASIILLIVAALSKQQLQNLYDYAIENNLEVICEVHDQYELEAALELNPEIIGINNRNLKTFTVTMQTTEKLAKHVKNKDILILSESGIRSMEDAITASNAGAEALLVGETLMCSTDIPETFQQLQVNKQKRRPLHVR
ncbi:MULTISPECIES: indole-3-glycerol phosphate synthase TrpC [Clostridia]|uniref:indole-3-glycerol phosphate synthase TrpC n=1 Tax=Clostridia TaxID=186801 RepID=UPI000EA084A9|nr:MULTISPECIES: indole-3-glycerol phosphate synthase TrpC [Clostridia]NBJ68064.1 indole-3-glycerol phosphate synthase TrpC [Roseburia sp. 1XD42-34]RKI82505.1 indole-3-glycerol phosphate synthase TrpC [Clostridium sp. 1xD42-85]